MSSPYGGEHFDEAIRKSQRSDWSFVATRLVTLAITFFFLARAVTQGSTAAYLLLPLALEFVTIMWVGLFLSLLVADSHAFVEAYRKPVRVVFWTLLLVSVLSVVLAWEGGEGFDLARIGPGWTQMATAVVRNGLVWAIVVNVIGLLVSTVRELLECRRSGSVFLWHSVFSPSFRVAVVVLMALFSPFVLIPLADSLLPWLLETPRRMAWTAFAFLLFVELAALAMGVGMHREAGAKKEETTTS